MSTNQSEASSAAPIVEVQGVTHSYRTKKGERQVLKDVSFSVQPGEFVCIVGPSGVGKTTILRDIAGLQPVTAGSVQVAGRVLEGPSRDIGLVFQDYSRSLMPWLSVADNVELPLRDRVGKAERRERVDAAIREVGLEHAVDSKPWQLSGGMQQRVAIARAMAFGAPVLLMDEPFASVDAQTRADLEDLTLRVRQDTGQAVLLITHDIDEAIYLADRVVVLGGRPASVLEEVIVPFGPEREQLKTKNLPEFGELRRKLHGLIERAAKDITQSISVVGGN